MKYKLKEIFDLEMGKTPSRNNADYWNTKDYKWISIADLTKAGKYISDTKEYLSENAIRESGIKVIPPNTVIMSFKLSIGKTSITTENMYSNEAIMAFHDKHVVEMLPEYIFYMFKYKNWDEGSNKAVMGKTLNKATLSEMIIEICSIEKQREIVKLLDMISDVLLGRKNELLLLDNLIQARFVELFGDPLDKKKANMFFTECLEFNPKKSEVKNLQDIKASFVPMECIGTDGSFTIRDSGKVREYYEGYTYFRDGDVLLAKITPCFENGKVAIAEGCENGIGFGTTEFHVFRPKYGISNSYWIKYLLKNESVHKLATMNMSGSAGQKRIQTPFFQKLKIFLPSLELQNQFADFVRATDKLKVEVQKSLDETQTLFDSLMQKYFG